MLFGLVVVAAVVVGARVRGLRAVLRPWLVSTAGVALVAAAHFALGFSWFVGLARLRVRYYQQTASDRPYSYFVWANLAAWLVAWSPLLAYAVVRAVGVLLRSRRTGWSEDVVVALMSAAGTAAALVADLSAMSKAETERIWLTFGVVAYAALALGAPPLVLSRGARPRRRAGRCWSTPCSTQAGSERFLTPVERGRRNVRSTGSAGSRWPRGW